MTFIFGICNVFLFIFLKCVLSTSKSQTDCPPGWFGVSCEEHCSPHCSSISCHRDSGECQGHCESGYYGYQCNDVCSRDCVDGCEKLTGRCNQCAIFRYGMFCEKTCSPSCNPHISSCSERICDKDSGRCLCGCKEKTYGEKCELGCPPHCVKCQNHTTCYECRRHSWGARCEKTCPDDCLNQACDKITGKCYDCDGTKYGDTCSQLCPINCLVDVCFQNGTCANGCKNLNFYGDRCDIPCSALTSTPNCKECQQIRGGMVECKLCRNGTYGILCEQQCPENCLECENASLCTKCKERFTGQQCDNKCLVSNCSECDGNGYCLECNHGKFGQHCEYTCQDCETCVADAEDTDKFRCLTCARGKYIFAERNICIDCDERCTTCENGHSCISCRDGFYGRSCHLTCPSTCQSCVSEKDCKVCKFGWTGSRCQCNRQNCLVAQDLSSWCTDDGECKLGCRNGHFGSNCQFNCVGACETCEQHSGKCLQCISGQYGLTCNENCSTKCAYKDMKGNALCNFRDGSCFSCENGWYGSKCGLQCYTNCLNNEGVYTCHINGTCEKCSGNKYGPTCELDCPENCDTAANKSSCDKITGDCVSCRANFSGELCCPKNCIDCSADGTCTRCKTGFAGKTCSSVCLVTDCLECGSDGTCIVCKAQKYGKSCEYSCPQCESCTSDSGTSNKSICISCPDGKYLSADRRSCNHCSANCKTCENGPDCLSCKEGYFGPACVKKCPRNCKTCVSESECTACKHGWIGSICQCPNTNCSREGLCTSNISCSRKCESHASDETCDFYCIGECAQCEQNTGHCLKCAHGLFGQFCADQCSTNCADQDANGTPLCHFKDGSCYSCKNGWRGLRCEKQCNQYCLNTEGIYGCRSNGSCDRCRGKKFGESCEKNCSVKCASVTQMESNCDKVTGRCSTCRNGLFGESCNISCNKECVTGCDRISGHCAVTHTDQTDESAAAGTIAIVIVAVCIIVGVIVAVVILRQRRFRLHLMEKLTKRADTVDNTFMAFQFSRDSHHGDRQSLLIPLETIYDTVTESDIPDDTGMEGDKINEKESGYAVPTRVPVSKFVRYVRGRQASGPDWFEEEFARLPQMSNEFAENQMASGNAEYGENVITGYSGASYVDGFRKKRAFLSAKGPTEQTINEFWMMLWTESCMEIVMLANLCEDGQVALLFSGFFSLTVMCFKYWPDEKIQSNFGSLDVILSREELYPDYIIRTFKVFHNITGEVRDVKQFHFLAWPDREVPESVSSLLCFRSKIIEGADVQSSPVLVHCSSGQNRTSTFIALDYLLQQALNESQLDVFRVVTEFRKQHANFVLIDTQYEFLYDAIVEWMTVGKSRISAVEGSHYFCGLLKCENEYSELSDKQHEKHYEFIDDDFVKSPKTSGTSKAMVEPNHYYCGLLSENVAQEVTPPSSRYGKLPDVSRSSSFMSSHSSHLSSDSNMTRRLAPASMKYDIRTSEAEETDNNMYLTCCHEQK